MSDPGVVRATVDQAQVAAALLDAFNREFATPTPGPQAIAARLAELLAGDSVAAFLAGDPAVGIALVTLRPNVWYTGPVGLLDELYVAPAHRSRGLGTRLLAAAEAWVTANDGTVLEINVDGEDIDARRFYERHGYSDREPGAPVSSLFYFKEW